VSTVDVRVAVAAAAATALGACALTPVFSSSGWVLPVLAVVLVVLAGGVLLRLGGPALWNRLASGRPVPDRVAVAGVVLVPVGQLFLVLCLMTARYAPGEALAGVVPTWSSLAELGAVLSAGRAEIQEQATPALTLTGLVALTVVFVAMVAVVVDLVAVAGRQAALAGLGLLVLYCVPVATITGGIGLIAIAAPAAGLALLLWTDQHRRLAEAGRRPRTSLGAGAPTALRIGGASLVAGLVLGSLVPTLAEGSFATGLGGGSGNSTGTSLDPVAAMRGQLTLPEPIHLLRVRSSVADPGALRAVTLDQYDARAGWSMSNLDGETSIAEDDRLAPLPVAQPGREVAASIEVLQHDDRFLPVPVSPLSVHMTDGDDDGWRFDRASGTLYGRQVTSAGRSYAVGAEEPRPTAQLLAQAGFLAPDSPVQQRYTALPFLDRRITATVAEVLAGAEGPYERVHAIHAYLTDRANGFRYSLSTEPGTSGDDLVDFLRLKRGYCEQYAGAMAVMVRAAGVPARVVLGYTPGSPERDGSRLVTSDDAHAWVEVYFQDLGWVPFDPTPISRTRAVDLPWAPRADAPSNGAGELDGPAPSAPAQAVPTPRTDRAGDPVAAAASGGSAGGPGAPLLAGAGAALFAALLLGVPGVVRARQRRRRLVAGSAGALWDELTGSAHDLDVRLHPTWTPRRTAVELTARLDPRTGGAAADAVLRLALAEEAASYGPAAGPRAHPDLAGALRTARRGLLAAATRPARLRARWWPASLMTGAAGRVATAIRRRLPARAPLRRRPRSI
jgi:hypothetical protein